MADDRSLGEAHRRLDQQDKRLDDAVPREVFNTYREAMQTEIARIVRELEAARSAARVALYGLAATVTGSVIAGLLLANKGS